MMIYLIRNKVSGKCYIGQTRRTLVQRFNAHKQVVGKSNSCKALSDAMQKYGVENFTAEILRECESQADMDFWEIKLIAEYGTFYPGGYNLTHGGGGKSGYKHSAESIEKRSVHFRGKKLTEEHKRKVSASLLGNKRALGLRHSEETKRKISEMQRGKKRAPFSESHKEKIAAARRGTNASDAARKKMSEGQKRRNALKRQSEAISLGQLPLLELT